MRKRIFSLLDIEASCESDLKGCYYGCSNFLSSFCCSPNKKPKRRWIKEIEGCYHSCNSFLLQRVRVTTIDATSLGIEREKGSDERGENIEKGNKINGFGGRFLSQEKKGLTC